MQQLVTPNINIRATRGLCLQYVDDAVNAPSRMPTAQMSFNRENANGNVRGGQPPVGLWVPIYFSLNKGAYAGYGHVAWAYNHGDWVEIHDSEVHAGARGIYRSIAEILAWFGAFGMQYLGWSSYVDGVHVVGEREAIVAKPQPPQFVAMNEPRVMLATSDLHKYDPDTHAWESRVALPRGDYRMFVDKVILPEGVFLRTQYDANRGNRRGFDLNKLVNVPSDAAIQIVIENSK